MCVCVSVCVCYCCFVTVMSDSATPQTVACQAPLSMEYPRKEYWSGLPFLSTEGLLRPGVEHASPALEGRFFITEPPGKP